MVERGGSFLVMMSMNGGCLCLSDTLGSVLRASCFWSYIADELCSGMWNIDRSHEAARPWKKLRGTCLVWLLHVSLDSHN
jgi:hypothetical protein